MIKQNVLTPTSLNGNRLATKTVKIGKVSIGAEHPICVQSMATSNTNDIAKVVAEVQSIFDAGADIVRLTVPNKNAVQSLEKIKSSLLAKGYDGPLVADVHFTPNAALLAASIVEKVRINPGNFVDRKIFSQKVLSDDQYLDELKRIEEKFVPLLDICKKNNTALRIGTNHGSLSDRIVTRYGDSPEGMVYSALEFLEIAERHDFFSIVFSMKSSNPIVMVHAYRLLVQKMKQRGALYPLHLGVTEAGDQEQGRVKSAVGISTLLVEGIGDTVRVSLTEPAENEVPVAKKIIHLATQLQKKNQSSVALGDAVKVDVKVDENYPTVFEKRLTKATSHFGGNKVPKVIFAPANPLKHEKDFLDLGFQWMASTEKWRALDVACDALFVKDLSKDEYLLLPPMLGFYYNKQFGEQLDERFAEQSGKDFSNLSKLSKNNFGVVFQNFSPSFFDRDDWESNFVQNDLEKLIFFSLKSLKELISCEEHCKKIASISNAVLVISLSDESDIATLRKLIKDLDHRSIRFPIALHLDISKIVSLIKEVSSLSRKSVDDANHQEDLESRLLAIVVYLASLFVDGLIDGVVLENTIKEDLETVFLMLQAVRQRIAKPEYISCPSCGRTLFDLQEVTAKIKAETSHLKGVKIGIMGCIVNGPGEMADADFGYVGSGVGVITLYKGREIVKRNIPAAEAVNALVGLIKENGMWREKT